LKSAQQGAQADRQPAAPVGLAVVGSSARALGHKESGKAMTTYRAIQDDIKRRHGRTVKRCWIVHAKELNGLSPRIAPNRLSPA